MSISINTANSANVAAQPLSTQLVSTQLSSTALGSAASTLAVPASQTASTPITVSAVDPQDHTRLDKYLKALNAPLQMGVDAGNIANALVSTMQSVVKERPDLANAQFDFASSNGTIAVSSATLSEADKNWLQGKLNSNTALVQAVKSFHDDAVSGYTTWADADGKTLSQSESDAISKQADGLTSFMSLFNSMGSEVQSSLMTGGTYSTPDGAQLNLAQNPGSANGFLSFMQSVQAAKDGTATFTSTSGRTSYGVLRANIFEMSSSAIPNFFPPSDTQSLGFTEKA